MLKGGGGGEKERVLKQLGPIILSANAIEQRISGGRLFIQNARNLHTKVMSNGVEVIVRGHKTALIGFEKIPWLPHRVHPTRPVTLPGHTVSRQFHLVDVPGKHNHGIAHLLQSIVRSNSPDLVTKTMLTTFTYMTTVLKRSNTIVKSREETISNVLTSRFRPTMEYTASLKSVSNSPPDPELLASYLHNNNPDVHSFVTDTLKTTYVYYNTFSAGGGPPIILTSRETVSNVLTIPAYLISPSPSMSSTRIFETETYYSTYTFSKTVLDKEKSTDKVLITKETVTQVVVTEALLPIQSQQPEESFLMTPQFGGSDLTKTYLTTFTHMFTELNPDGNLVIRSTTSLASEIVTEIMESSSSSSRISPSIVGTIDQTKILTPVLLYATKVYYTTYTYFTTVRNKDATDGIRQPPKIHSRTQVVSRVVTEALETAFDLNYVNQLKSSYLSKHSTLLDIESSVEEIIPTRTIDVMAEATERPMTLITQQVFHPHWPKDNDQLAVEIEPSTMQPPIEIKGQLVDLPQGYEKLPAELKIRNPPPQMLAPLSNTPVISSSEEHFDEVKEGVHKIVSVLTNTKVPAPAAMNMNVQSYLKPTRTYNDGQLYTTRSPITTTTTEEPISSSPEPESEAPDAFVEEITLTDDLPETTEIDGHETVITERPVSHLPTPPLTKSTVDKYTISAAGSGGTKSRKPPIKDHMKTSTTDGHYNLFPNIGGSPSPSSISRRKSIVVDYPSDILDYSDDFIDDFSSAMAESDFRASSTMLAKRTGTMFFEMASPHPPYRPYRPTPSSEILNLISDIAYDEMMKESEEDIPPPTIYSIPTTFDTEAYNQQQSDIAKLNKTLQAIKLKQQSQSSKKPWLSVVTEKPPSTTTTTTTTMEPQEIVDEVTEELNDDKIQDTNSKEQINFMDIDDILNGTISDADLDVGSNGTLIIEIDKSDEEESDEKDATEDNVDIDKPTGETLTIEDEPPPIVVEKAEEDIKIEDDVHAVVHESDVADDEEVPDVHATTKKPKTKTKYTSRPRPTRPNNRKKTKRPVSFHPFSDEDSGESSTNIYALGPIRGGGGSNSDSEEEDDEKDKQETDKESDEDSSASDEKPALAPNKRRRRPQHHHQQGNKHNEQHKESYSGPSKSAISFPVAAAGGASAVATAATSAINWKPLLNLGAIGLGGLGASTLTKLGPLFNSVAGYMKGALVPISRNDTQGAGTYKNSKKSGRRPYNRLPPKESPVLQHSEPIYIPLHNTDQQNEINQNFRFTSNSNSGGNDGLQRRPVITHANEPNFRPLGNGREPDLIAGPLPPPIHHHNLPEGYPLDDIYNNFKPPNDNMPNLFSQMINNNDHDDRFNRGQQQQDVHKNGDPLPPDQQQKRPSHITFNDQRQPTGHERERPGFNEHQRPPFPTDSRPDFGHDSENYQNQKPPTNVIHIVPGEMGGHINNNEYHSHPEDHPEGKTEFVLRPLQNLMNGRPMFDNGAGNVQQQRPGLVTPVLRPTISRPQNPDPQRTPPQGPMYKPRPGPASIEMINEIKDSQRPPQIILPQRKPFQNQNNVEQRPPGLGPRPQGPLRINIPGLNIHSDSEPHRIPWANKHPGAERFNENPFKDGNFNPPEMSDDHNHEHENTAASHESSFENHFSHGAQDGFFNQPGFITHDHFNELMSTQPPKIPKYPSKFKPEQVRGGEQQQGQGNQNNNNRGIMMMGPPKRPPPPFRRPLDQGQGSQIPPQQSPREPPQKNHEGPTSEESIFPHHDDHSQEIHDDDHKFHHGQGQGELILYPHNGQNRDPFRPIPGSKEQVPSRPPSSPPRNQLPEDVFGMRDRDRQKILNFHRPINHHEDSDENFGNQRPPPRPPLQRPNDNDHDDHSLENQNQRPPLINQRPTNLINPGNNNVGNRIRPSPLPQRPNDHPLDHHDEQHSSEDQNQRPPPINQRPNLIDPDHDLEHHSSEEHHNIPRPPPPFRPPQVPQPPQHHPNSNEFKEHHNSAEDLFHNQHNLHSKPPQLPPWPNNSPGPGQIPGLFPGPMNIVRPSNNNQAPNKSPGGWMRDVPPLRQPPLAASRPTQHLPPFRQNPTTTYIVEEDHHEDEHDHHQQHQEHESGEEEHENFLNNHRHDLTTSHPREHSNDLRPKLVIKEIPTRPAVPFQRRSTTTTTSSPTTPIPSSTTTQESAGNNPSTNRALISRLFIRRFTTTTPAPPNRNGDSSTTSTSFPRFVPPWAVKTRATSTPASPTTSTSTHRILNNEDDDGVEQSTPILKLNELLNFEEKFKQKYGQRGRPGIQNRNDNYTTTTSSHSQDVEIQIDDYSDEMDEDKASSNMTLLSKHDPQDHRHHPNHHPVHKPPIDVTKYLKDVDHDEFGQLYQGTEDQDTIIDPISQKIIKSPIMPRRNISGTQFMRRSTTTEGPNDDETTTIVTSTTTHKSEILTSSEEDEVLKRYTVPNDMVFVSSPAPPSSKLWWPTTFRPKQMSNEIINDDDDEDDKRATTYRPNSRPSAHDILLQPSSSERVLHVNRRPFIQTRPTNSPRPAPQGGMASFYDDDDGTAQIKVKNSEIHKLPPFTKRPGGGLGIALVRPEDLEEYEKGFSRDKLNKVEDTIKEYHEDYDESSLETVPSGGLPTLQTKLQPPGQIPQRSQRPSAFETITNLFKRPEQPTNNNTNSRRPFIPQKRPPQIGNNNTNIQLVRPAQTNPNLIRNKEDDKNEIKDNVISTSDNKKTGSEIKEAKANEPSVNPAGTGHRESSYIYDSEYYEDDEDEAHNLIPPKSHNLQQPHQNNPPPGRGQIVFQQRPKVNPPQQQSPSQNNNGRPFNNNQRPSQPQQRPQFNQRPPFPLPPPPSQQQGNRRLPGTGFRIYESNGNGRPSAGHQQNIPKTEMEPPPIDSNRLKPPVLELPSNGPIRYRPGGGTGSTGNDNVHRPNLLRPDDDLFKPQDKRPNVNPTVHTIASVDDFNKIVGTNTFTAILPSNSLEVKPSTGSNSGGGIVVIVSPTPTRKPSPSSVVKYAGGKLQTSKPLETEDNERDTEEEEDEDEELDNPQLNIQPTRSSSTRLTIQRTRGPSLNVTTTTTATTSNRGAPPSTTKSVSSSTSSSTSVSSTPSSISNIRNQILNRRPPIQIVRTPTTITPNPQNNLNETTKTSVRRPFIPTRGPGPNIVPWARRPQPSSTTVLPKLSKSSSAEQSGNNTTILKFSATSIGNKNRNRFIPSSNKTISTTTLISTSVSSSSKEGQQQRFDESKSGSKIEVQNLKPTTFRPLFSGNGGKRPGFSRESSSSEENRSRFVPRNNVTTTTTLGTTTTTTTTTTTRRPSIFRNVTTHQTPIKTTSTAGGGDDSEYEEYSYEEEITESPSSSSNKDNNRELSTAIIGVENKTVTVVTHISSEISPTRISSTIRGAGAGNRYRNPGAGGFRRPGSSEKGPNNNPALENMTTRYVTHTDSNTKTITETETSAITSRGVVQTQTIIITKTIPPQTRISTIVGTVTLVNTLDIQPTVVKTTIFSEPTKTLHTFVDTSESPPNHDEEQEELGAAGATNNVQLAGIITRGNRNKLPKPDPSPSEPGGNIIKNPFNVLENSVDCPINCTINPSQNLACRSYANGTRSKCDCKPGYARIKTKYPCRPTFTYEMKLGIQHMDGMLFDFKDLYNAATDAYLNFITVTKEAIDKAFLATDIQRQFQGSEIIRVTPIKERDEPRVEIDFLVQLKTNITEERIKNHLLRTLKDSNYSIARSGISATRDAADYSSKDFNECDFKEFNDCSLNSECINVRGSFTCKCKSGYKDKSSKRKPGRDCQETSGCAECNFRGTCHKDSRGNRTCHCFRWYGGADCQINLKFMLIAITGIGSVLFILVMLCGTLVCRRSKISRGMGERPGSGRFMRYRSPASQATLERTAIMNDSASSEGRQSPHPITHSFTPDSLLIDVDPKGPSGHQHISRHPSSTEVNVNLMNFSLRNVVMEQDRSGMGGGMGVVIPRAKIKVPSRPSSGHAAAMGADTNADLASTERKLISYLDQSPYAQPNKPSGSNQSTIIKNERQFRKFSLQEQRKISQGALVSSGEAVSAIGGMRRRSTTALDPMEPTYTTGYEKSVSEVRSYDETIRCPAKPQTLYTTDTSRASCYSCKPPSYCAYSESHGHTMGDKDGASTVYTSQGKLFRMAHHHDDTDSTASSQ